MPQLIALMFSDRDMPVRYNPVDLTDLRPEEFVVAKRGQSEDVACVAGVEWVSRKQLQLRGSQPERIVRRASDAEKDNYFVRKAMERKALNLCKAKAVEMKLPMKVTRARLDEKEGKLIFHFTSDQRVDFRQLVRDLSALLKARVELWQIGVRDEAKLVDGFGVCGLRTCCSQWLPDFRPINIRMAKVQDINLPPTKLSGQCGRLLCCLSYEVDQYKEMAASLLPKGATVQIDGQDGVITDRNVILQRYEVRYADGTKSVHVRVEDLEAVRVPDQLKKMAAVFRTVKREEPEGEGADAVTTAESTKVEPAAPSEAPAVVRSEKEESAVRDEGRKKRRRRRSRKRSETREGDAASPATGGQAQAAPSSRRKKPGGGPSGAGAGEAGAKEASGRSKRRRRGGRKHGRKPQGGGNSGTP